MGFWEVIRGEPVAERGEHGEAVGGFKKKGSKISIPFLFTLAGIRKKELNPAGYDWYTSAMEGRIISPSTDYCKSDNP